MTTRYEDFREDDAFDENGLLRDGHKTRVPLTMRDAMTPLQREIATKRARVTDGNGNITNSSSEDFNTNSAVSTAAGSEVPPGQSN